MIYKRLLSYLNRQKKNSKNAKTSWNYTIDVANISANALKVLASLQEAGYAAYLVGGGVRDLLVDKIPKDFDVATNASPEEIRRLFRNSRIIGRRFRLVHVFYRNEIIEVSTFRAQVEESMTTVVTDNTYGTIEEDAWRRDFTVNALYYHVKDQQVVDYTGGMTDLRQQLIRVIGDPFQRFHEDPVRLLRAIRLAAKLQFRIDLQAETSLRQLSNLLQHVAKARLFDEVLKLFFSGYAWLTHKKLCEYGYFAVLFPLTHDALHSSTASSTRLFVELAIQETDRRFAEGYSLNPGFLLAVLLWAPIQEKLKKQPQKKFYQSLRHVIEEVLQQQSQILVIPHRLASMMRAIWLLQYYLTKPRNKRIYRTFFHRYFRAAFDFLRLRVQSGEPEDSLLEWWNQFRQASSFDRQRMLEKIPTHNEVLPGED